MYYLNKEEIRILEGIIDTLYMQKTIELIEKFVWDSGVEEKTAYRKMYDYIFKNIAPRACRTNI